MVDTSATRTVVSDGQEKARHKRLIVDAELDKVLKHGYGELRIKVAKGEVRRIERTESIE